MTAHSAARALSGYQLLKFKIGVTLVAVLCLAALRADALDACGMLSVDEIFAALNAPDVVTEGHSEGDSAHLSTCLYRSSRGASLTMVISDTPTAYDDAQRSRPQGQVSESPVENLGDRALVWDTEDETQAIAALGQKFVRITLSKQPGSDVAKAQKLVISFARQALNADWEAVRWESSRPLTAPKNYYMAAKDSTILTHKVSPVYPPLARQMRIQGQVVLKALIDKDGSVERLQAMSGHPMLAPAAIDAVKQWQYKPYLIDGQPVEVETEVHVNFSLSNDSGDKSPASPPQNSPQH